MPVFDFTDFSPVQVLIAFYVLGVAFGFIVHFLALAGTAARWALNASS